MAGTLLAIALAALTAFALAEVLVRVLGLAGYPLFVRSEAIGYHFRPNWRANVRGRSWRTNAIGLRLDHDRPPSADSIVIVGDSTVEDGVGAGQDQTIAARLAKETGRDVYPVACPAWSLENQLAFLRAHPELYDAGTIVFVSNSWDLASANRWIAESVLPTRPPHSHAWFLLMRATYQWRRKLFPRSFPPWPDEADQAWKHSVGDLLERCRGRIVWLFYPLREELVENRLPCPALRALVQDRAETRDLGETPGWSLDCYRDAVHPTARGRELLRRALLEVLGFRQDAAAAKR